LTKKITRKIIAADQALNDFHLPAKARERGMSFGNNLSPSAPLPYLHLILPQDLNSMRDFRSVPSWRQTSLKNGPGNCGYHGSGCSLPMHADQPGIPAYPAVCSYFQYRTCVLF